MAVENWLDGGYWQLVEEVVEVESGKSHHDRPGLTKALEACRRYGARLIISRLDRLSRDPVFLLSLRDAGIDFVAVDIPHAKSADHRNFGDGRRGREREAISAPAPRRRSQAARARGVEARQPAPGDSNVS